MYVRYRMIEIDIYAIFDVDDEGGNDHGGDRGDWIDGPKWQTQM